MKKVIVFYISRHSGHFHAASAIESGLLEVDRRCQIDKINAFNYTNPILEKIINKAYIEVIKNKPEIWGHIYDNPNFMKKTKTARDALHKFNMSKVRKLLDRYEPDVIYCTQAFPCGMVADYKRSCGKNIPLIGILTDHAPHAYWLFDEVDYYVVPSRETAQVLKDKGVPSHKVKEYGIPIDPKFMRRNDGKRIRRNLGLDPESPTVLVMGGTQGLGVIEETVRFLLQDMKHNYQLLVVAGANKKLKNRLGRLCRRKKWTNNMRIFSYVENINELMDAADIIISKAGGMTIAEALQKRVPMLIVDPIPGHERMNTDYLVGKGVAIDVGGSGNIYQEINKLFDSRKELDKMSHRCEKLAKPHSALDIAKLAFK